MKEFSKDVHGLLDTSYSPIDRGCLSYTSYRVIVYFLTMPKGGPEPRMEGIALSTQKGLLITALPPCHSEMVCLIRVLH
jgi:hypothetical protein